MMDAAHHAAVAEALALFGLPAAVSVRPLGNGHIHDTFRVETPSGTFAMQRINRTIFPDVPSMMTTIGRVTNHIRAGMERRGLGDRDRRAPLLMPARDGNHFAVNRSGDYWRIYRFVEQAHTVERDPTPAQAREASRAFGAFAAGLADLPPPVPPEIIPGFHDTRARFRAFTGVLRLDPAGRAATAAPEIRFALGNESMTDVLKTLQTAGRISTRVVHNDTKINNVLFDDVTGEALCVLDLDTVMPGLVLHDIGDLIRTVATTGPEDEPDPGRIACDAQLFEAVVEGYLESARALLNNTELALIPFAGRVITFETGLRFLTDYLAGDVYFKTARERHNLERARAQFALAASLAAREKDLLAIVQKHA